MVVAALRLLGGLALATGCGGSQSPPCVSRLAELCPSAFGPAACGVCAGTHQSPLRVAGCANDDIQRWCSVVGAV